MKILKIDRKLGIIEVVPQTTEDLWHLSKIIEIGDWVSGSTERKIKPQVEGEKAIKVRMHLDLQVEKTDFQEFSDALRIAGIILGGKPAELIELKAHHTLDLLPGEKIRIQKKKIMKWQIERLEKARAASAMGKLLAILIDDEAADFFNITDFGYTWRLAIRNQGGGKQYEEDGQTGKYLNEVIEKIIDAGIETVIIAGPGFTRGTLEKIWKQKKTKRKIDVFFFASNSTGVTGMNELLKSGTIDAVAKEFEISKHAKLMEHVMAELGKNSGLVTYGLNEVENAAISGAVEVLLIEESLLGKEREKTEKIMEMAEKNRGKITILSEKEEAGKKLGALSGIAALLRYKI